VDVTLEVCKLSQKSCSIVNLSASAVPKGFLAREKIPMIWVEPSLRAMFFIHFSFAPLLLQVYFLRLISVAILAVLEPKNINLALLGNILLQNWFDNLATLWLFCNLFRSTILLGEEMRVARAPCIPATMKREVRHHTLALLRTRADPRRDTEAVRVERADLVACSAQWICSYSALHSTLQTSWRSAVRLQRQTGNCTNLPDTPTES